MVSDLLYERAVAYVTQENDTSCAGLQRNLDIGYEKAVELRVQMEENGVFLNLKMTTCNENIIKVDHTIMEEDSKNVAEPFFKPWIGADYAASDERLLILGESHYGDESMSGNSTITFTQEYVDGQNHRFWTSIMQVVRGQPYWELDRREFWQSVAFYNYVQQPVAETAKVAPTSEMFSLSRDAFFSVLSQLAPRKILVLSNRLWENMPAGGLPGPQLSFEQGTRETLLYQYEGGQALASWVPHPSYNFSWPQWHPMIKALLEKKFFQEGVTAE